MSNAVVVGASSATAQRTIELLASRGDRVVGVNLTAFEHPDLTHSLAADMRDPAAATATIEEAARLLGGLDVVVTGLARQRGGRLDDTNDSTWREVMAGTLDATFHTMRAALPLLVNGGSIVAITSVNSWVAHPGNAAYAVAKGAVTTMVTQAALEYAPLGIRVNAVAPGLIDGTGLEDPAAGYPMGRVVTASEVAEAIAFLASPAASGITGTVLPVDAGLSVASPVAFVRETMLTRWRDGTAELRDR